MSNRPLTKQREMLENIFNEKYHRKINSFFGVDSAGRKNSHKGVDYGANSGEALYPPVKDSKIEITAVQDKVNQNFWGRKPNTIQDWGNYVLLYLIDYDITFSYAHLNKVNVKVGDVIGYEKVGEAGNTGYSSGPHLDLMVAKGKHTSLFSIRDNAIDPETITLKKINVKSVNDIAQEVINGKWGNGRERVDKLTKAGHDHKKVQAKVNEILKVKPNSSPKPKPKPKQAVVQGYLMLYRASTGSANYGKQGKKQNLKKRTMEIFDEKNGRILVNAKPFRPAFDVDSFWLNKSDVELL